MRSSLFCIRKWTSSPNWGAAAARSNLPTSQPAIAQPAARTSKAPTGDLAGIAKKYQGLNLLRRMLYPAGQGPAGPTARATFTLAAGQTIVAPVVAEDDFSITVLDPLGARQTYQRSAVSVTINDPLAAHFDQLGKYTDAEMHNVYAYLEALK